MDDSQKISKKLLTFNAVLVLAIVGMTFIIYDALNPKVADSTPVVAKVSHEFDSVHLQAKSAYVLDISENKIIYKKNEFAQLPLASLTKLMTALVATEMLPKESHVTIRPEFLSEDGDTGLLADESWRLRDLLDFSLVVSSNDGARSIASVVGAFDLNTTDFELGRKDFIDKMNARAIELGLKQTYFINESGLDAGNMGGGNGSAIDVANLLKYILVNKPALLEATKQQTAEIDSLLKTHIAKNTNSELGNIPGLIASKTGYTELAGGNLAVAFDASVGHPIIIVVLGSTEKGRFDDVVQLVTSSLKYVNE